MKIRLFFSLILLAFFVSACGSPKFDSMQNFRQAKEGTKIDYIQGILKDHNLDANDENIVKYINHVLSDKKYYEVLVNINSESNFPKFLEGSVQTLYHAYSPDKFKRADQNWQKSAKNFLLEAVECHYGTNKEKLKEYLSGTFSSELDKFFMFYKSQDPEGAAGGKYAWEKSELLNYKAWDSVFTFKDFKELDNQTQRSFIKNFLHISGRIHQGKELDEQTIKFLDKVESLWFISGDYFLNDPLSKINNNTKIHPLMADILSLMNQVWEKNS